MPAQPFMEEEESIYRLLPLPTPAPNKAPLYHSKHPHSTPPTASTFGASTATANLVTNAGGEYDSPARVHQHVKEYGIFGPKGLHQPNPLGFTSAHTHAALPKPNKYTYTDRRKEALNVRFNNTQSSSSSSPSTATSTSASSLSNTNTRNNKNFIKDNATTLSSPEAKKLSSSTRLNRNTNPLLNNYRSKPDYGQTPAYLSSVKQQVAAEQKIISDTLQAQLSANQTPVQLLAEPDRLALLTQLKLRWEEVMQQYQVLTHQTTNTLSIGNQKRKEELEKKLAEIEKSITKMEKPFVVIQQN